MADPDDAARFTAELLVALRAQGLLGAPYDGPLSAGYAAVSCVDNAQPAGPASFVAAVDALDVPLFGALRAYDDSVCTTWTAADDRHRLGADHHRRTVLLMNSRFDPATPLAAAQRLHGRLPGSALLVHEGGGHVTVQQSGCMTDAASAYLVDGTLPGPGATCGPDRVPFS